jgi:hypothetical protein
MNKAVEPFIHFHIPKTAGTSLRAACIDQLGPENVAFMMPDRKLVRASDLPFETKQLDRARRLARKVGLLKLFSTGVSVVNQAKDYDSFELAEMLAQNVTLATGHFVHSDITEPVVGIPRTTVLREPLKRAWSHYSHWREAKGAMWWHEGVIAYSDEVKFEMFATDPKLTNYQANCLGSLTFKVIGYSGKLPEFIEEMGLNPDPCIPNLNPGLYREMPSFDPRFLRDFRNMNAVDYGLYEEAVQRFG